MAVSVLERPVTYVTDATQVPMGIDNISGFASYNIVTPPHNLVDGNVIYAHTPVESYNGFWVIDVQTIGYFFVKRYDSGDLLPYIKDVANGDAYYNVAGIRSWSSVHLPICYRLSNDLWPTNSVDTARDITNVTDSNGYCSITAAGDIKTTGSAQVLDYVKITGCTNEDLNGVWQILTYISDTSFVLNIPYSAGADTDLTNNGTVQYYYNNYVVKVQVWGGLNTGHEWYAQKPYELLATLSLIPDENNEVFFSISEILKKQIEIENNLLIDSLPNNLDAFTMFFIKFGEEYDDSTQIYVGRTSVSYTDDRTNFEGKALNAVTPFKSKHQGGVAQYLLGSSTQKFLTNFEEPTLFSGKYFDLGFLWDGVTDIFFVNQFYKNGSVVGGTSIEDRVDSFYTGVYRGSPVDVDAINCDSTDRVDVTAYRTRSVQGPSVWTDVNAWSSKTSTTFNYSSSDPYPSSESYIDLGGTLAIGDKVKVSVTITLSGTHTQDPSLFLLLTQTGVSGTASQIHERVVSNGTATYSFIITATATANKLNIVLEDNGGTGTIVAAITPTLILQVVSSSDVISETKTINLNCDCTLAQAQDGIYLSWLNNLGHFDYWFFQGYKDNVIDIEESGETEVNIFPSWPNSYGEFADTSNRKQTFIKAGEQWVVRSSNLTVAQVEVLKKIKTSPLVQIVNSVYDRRTVIVDKNSFTAYEEKNKLHEISFTITYTDDVPSQRV